MPRHADIIIAEWFAEMFMIYEEASDETKAEIRKACRTIAGGTPMVDTASATRRLSEIMFSNEVT